MNHLRKKPPIIIGAGVGGLSIGALLVNHGYNVQIFEKSDRLGGRTTSIEFKNHILDNGFHIMPFYKKSSIYEVLKSVNIVSKLKLAIVDKIAFFDGDFHTYPKGIIDILRMSLIPLRSRFSLLKILLPMAFTSMNKAEQLDQTPLTEITKKLDEFDPFVGVIIMDDYKKGIIVIEDFGDLSQARAGFGGCSDSHGGLGGY